MRYVSLTLVSVLAITLFAAASSPAWAENTQLTVATFDIDVTPPIGAFLTYDPVVAQYDLGLRAKGVVLMGAGDPIVLCAFDWLGMGNEGYDAFRACLAKAAGTQPERVALHTLHQHDAPDCDFTVEALMKEKGMPLLRHNGDFAREVLVDLEVAVRKSLETAQAVTHLGLGKAAVEKVASNRRIKGKDGKVGPARYTACRDAKMRAEPEGVIDPELSLISLWNDEKPITVMSYYACHPQSYYRLGVACPDVPGIARFFRQLEVPDALHIHFNGAGGNIGAGKYNTGAHKTRLVLAERMAEGMRQAWENTQKQPIAPGDIAWAIAPVALPVGAHIDVAKLEAALKVESDVPLARRAARNLAWARRRADGRQIELSCLSLGPARLLHCPGELFVEYQLQAKALAPDNFVVMAAYGDFAPGYIGTAIAYEEGGYETSERVSRVAPEVEGVLMAGIKKLLKAK